MSSLNTFTVYPNGEVTIKFKLTKEERDEFISRKTQKVKAMTFQFEDEVSE